MKRCKKIDYLFSQLPVVSSHETLQKNKVFRQLPVVSVL
jgi:hypothetical protein